MRSENSSGDPMVFKKISADVVDDFKKMNWKWCQA